MESFQVQSDWERKSREAQIIGLSLLHDASLPETESGAGTAASWRTDRQTHSRIIIRTGGVSKKLSAPSRQRNWLRYWRLREETFAYRSNLSDFFIRSFFFFFVFFSSLHFLLFSAKRESSIILLMSLYYRLSRVNAWLYIKAKRSLKWFRAERIINFIMEPLKTYNKDNY